GFVTANYFTLLGARPVVGRLFDDRVDGATGSHTSVVLSHAFWTRRFQADPAIVGQAIRINGEPYTVIGVASPGFHGTSILLTDAWLPIEAGATPLLANRDMPWPLLGGRLKPGVSMAK